LNNIRNKSNLFDFLKTKSSFYLKQVSKLFAAAFHDFARFSLSLLKSPVRDMANRRVDRRRVTAGVCFIGRERVCEWVKASVK
jgi:hypothetical protein